MVVERLALLGSQSRSPHTPTSVSRRSAMGGAGTPGRVAHWRGIWVLWHAGELAKRFGFAVMLGRSGCWRLDGEAMKKGTSIRLEATKHLAMTTRERKQAVDRMELFQSVFEACDRRRVGTNVKRDVLGMRFKIDHGL